MKRLKSLLASLVAVSLGASPALAQVRSISIDVPAQSVGAAGAGLINSVPFSNAAALPSASLTPTLSAPSLSPSFVPTLGAVPVAGTLRAESGIVPSVVSPSALKAAVLPSPSKPAAVVTPVKPSLAALTAVTAAASKAVAGLDKAGASASREKGAEQFSVLVEEPLSAPSKPSDDAAPAVSEMGALKALSPLTPAAAVPDDQAPKAEPPAPKKPGITTVFKDPARNKAFWRYVTGYSVFLFGFEMYVVGLPYLISAMSRNSLKENRDARAGSEAAIKEVVRSNRSLSRIAHWVAQGLSYATIPLFTRNEGVDGPKKWLVRSMLIRAAVLAAVPVLFFATGALSVQASLFILLGLVAAQSFFQGISVTSEGGATTRILGDASVTSEERTKANSILTFVAAILSIIAPAVAGQIALIGPVMGKTGVGGAVIYAIYAGAIAVTGLIYASIKMIGGPAKGAEAKAASPSDAAPKGLGGTLKSLWTSIKQGTRIVFKDRMLRTMLLMSMVTSLFSDPLIFNVLPEYIEGLVAKNPGSVGAIMSIPGVGWFLKSLTATPMGNFALMMVMASVGSIVAALLIKPLTRLFKKLGFKTEEGLTIPFYFLAALEAPLFLLMIHTPTMLGAVVLYGLQSLVVGFIGIAISGLYQKNLGGQKDSDVNKILAAQSLLGIAAAIVSTFAYGFLLKDISIATSLLIAGVATSVMAGLRLLAPFLSFTRAQRKGTQDPPPGGDEPPTPPKHSLPPAGDHHGPNSIQSTHL